MSRMKLPEASVVAVGERLGPSHQLVLGHAKYKKCVHTS